MQLASSFHISDIFHQSWIQFNIPLTINNNAIIKTVTSRLHITFKSLHIHFSQFTLSLSISHKFSSFTHLQAMIRGQEQPMEDFYCSTEIMVKREIRNSQTRSTPRKTCHVEPKQSLAHAHTR